MRILVTGAKGMLGTDVAAEYTRRGQDVISLDHNQLDITDRAASVRAVAEARPEVVVNCAAYTDVDGAESNPNLALAVNAVGVRNLALACRESEAVLVQISTDYVFGGWPNPHPWWIYDYRSPSNYYGYSKYLGERFLEEAKIPYYLIRTSWLFGANGPNFVATMLRLGQNGEPVKVVNDQRGCPTYSVDLARALADLVETDVYGTYHVTNQGITSWHDFARAIFERAGLAVDLTPITSADHKRPAARPANSALSSWPLAETIGYLLPPWQDALDRYIGDYLAHS